MKFALGVFLCLLAAVLGPSSGALSGGVETSYSPAAQNLTLHEPVILNFSLRNASNQTVRVDLGQNRKGSYEFWVIPPTGQLLKLAPYRREVSGLGDISVDPGQTFSQELVLNEWYDFSTPGVYEFGGKITQPILIDSDAGTVQDSGFRATISIEPRDETRLTADCDALAKRVEASQSFAESAQAALALSYVSDPSAVPYLERVLFARKLVEPIAIRGLERIGSDEAIRVLASAISAHLPGHSTIFARQALQTIRQRTSDPARRELITEMLQQSSRRVAHPSGVRL